jgi:hypothetical protein
MVSAGGVQDTEVLEVLVAIVPDAEPNSQVRVWVKLLSAGVTLMVPAVPMVNSGTEIVGARLMGVNVTVLEPVTKP